MLDKRDVALQSLTPVMMVPKFTDLDVLQNAGHRFLMASDGLWMEVKRSWLELCVPIAQQHIVPMPYGSLERKVEFSFSALPVDYLKQFVEEAKRNLPYECAGGFIGAEGTQNVRFAMCFANEANSDFITYECPELEDDEYMIADIHSHGSAPAFFSSTDNEDDKTEVKIAVVVGNVDTTPTMKTRLCANGYFIDLPSYNFESKGDDYDA